VRQDQAKRKIPSEARFARTPANLMPNTGFPPLDRVPANCLRAEGNVRQARGLTSPAGGNVLVRGMGMAEASMALILVQCPRTRRCISTGIEADPATFELAQDGPKTVHCRFCRKEHVWTKRNALLVDPDHWSEVPEIEDCFIKAAESSERAARAKRAADRDFYLRMERKWLGLADGFRWIAELERRHG